MWQRSPLGHVSSSCIGSSSFPNDPPVKTLGSTAEPSEATARALLTRSLEQATIKEAVQQYGIQFGARIGGGYYSDVFKVLKLEEEDGEECCFDCKMKVTEKFLVKIVHASRCPKRSNYDNELAICKMIQRKPHPRLVTILQCFDFSSENPSQFWLLMPHHGLPISRFLAKCRRPKGRLPEPVGRRLFTHLVQALDFLHRNNVVHRDIKPENVLISRSNHDQGDGGGSSAVKYSAVLVDFGFAKLVPFREEEGEKWKEDPASAPAICISHKGTLEYMAPELLVNSLCYDAVKTDIYSAGVLLYYMLVGVGPFLNPSSSSSTDPFSPAISGQAGSLASMLGSYHRLKLQPIRFPELTGGASNVVTISSPAQELIENILQVKPESRPTLAKIKQHKWMTTNSTDALGSKKKKENQKPMKKQLAEKQSFKYPSTETF